MLHRLKFLPLAVLGLAAVAAASIERLTLRQMISKADAGVVGEIVESEVTFVPLDRGGVEMSFTTLHVQGHDLVSGDEVTVAVSYPGGVIGERGSYNSEAPSADDVKLGNRVVVFYKWSDNMGGGFAGKALYASHGGLFRTFTDRQGRVVVQGRGQGYAVSKNIRLTDLKTRSAEHARQKKEER